MHNNLVRRAGGLRLETCLVSEESDFLPAIPPEFDGLYSVVPRAHVQELLEIDDRRYCAVLSDLKGCANSGVVAQQVLAYLERRYAGRFRYVDHTAVERIVAGADEAVVHAGPHRVSASRAVLCTNGFVDHLVQDPAGSPVTLAGDQQIIGRVAHMTAFVEDDPRPPAAMSYIRNTTIGGENPYVYVTRRTYDRVGRHRHAHLHGRAGASLPRARL